jgi:hypothetical protein
VYHRPSGRFVTSFGGTYRSRRDTFEIHRIAKRFCQEIDAFADWSGEKPIDDPTLGLRLHAAALHQTGGRPDLHVIDCDDEMRQ